MFKWKAAKQSRKKSKRAGIPALSPLTIIEPEAINGLEEPGEWEEVVLTVDSGASEKKKVAVKESVAPHDSEGKRCTKATCPLRNCEW